MFEATYLGQQGWMIASSTARVLVDPLLTDEYSAGFSATIYPPRAFDFRRFPPVDVVVLSHEHADHLNLPSLAMLDRRIPIVLPARAARPVRDALVALGFRVLDAAPGSTFRAGDLTLTMLGEEIARDAELEAEWTALQILVSDRRGDGSFYSYGDGWPSDATISRIREAVGRIGVFCHANNTMDWSCLEAGADAGWPRGALDYAAQVVAGEAVWWRDGPAPAVTAVCGPGLAFVGEDQWMNQVLCADSERVCAALSLLAPERAFRAPIPGDTVALHRGGVRRAARAGFVKPLPRHRWPSLAVAAKRALVDEFAPACGVRSLDDAAWSVIERELDRLAAYLHRRALFQALLALEGRPLGRRQPAFALVLRCDDDDRAHVFEYQPSACRFARVRRRAPFARYVAGLECWASDLWRVFEGRLLHQRLLGHMRTWSYASIPSPLQAVWGFFDLVYRPHAAAAFYRAATAEVRDRRPLIHAGPRLVR